MCGTKENCNCGDGCVDKETEDKEEFPETIFINGKRYRIDEEKPKVENLEILQEGNKS